MRCAHWHAETLRTYCECAKAHMELADRYSIEQQAALVAAGHNVADMYVGPRRVGAEESVVRSDSVASAREVVVDGVAYECDEEVIDLKVRVRNV